MNRKYSAAELAFVKRRKTMPRRELHLAFMRRFPERRDVTWQKIKSLCEERGWGVGSLKGRKRGSSRYGKAELAFIERRRRTPRRDLHAAFVEKFDRHDVSFSMFTAICKNRGWTTGHAGSRAKKGQTKFSRAELAFIRHRRETPRAQLHREFVATFGRAMSFEAFQNFCKRFGALTGRTGQFRKGNVPWSAGKKIGNNAGSARTQFRKGQLPQNTKQDGHERVDKRRGIVLVRTSERNQWTGAASSYRPKHFLLWEKKHGAVPKGMALKCKGDPANADPSNWELVSRGVLPRLNALKGRNYDAAPAEVKPAMMAIAKLEQQVFERKKRAKAP